MDLTQEVLTPEELAGADPRALNFLLQSHAYQNFFVPLLVGIISRWHRELANPKLTRHWEKPDDYLRGGIRVAEMILNAPNEILSAQARRAREEDEANEVARHYDGRAQGGPQPPSDGPISPTAPIGA